MNWKRKKEDEETFDQTDLQRLEDIDETTFLGFNRFAPARDLLPVFKASELGIQY
jgi:hypothetical protein